VPYIVAEGGHAQNAPVIRQRVRVPQIWQQLSDLIRQVRRFRNHVKDTPSEFHHTKGVLETLVSGAWIKEIREGKLIDVP
jgi:hypothetical protein